MTRRAEISQAEAIAAEILTPDAAQKIETTIVSLNAGCDQRVALRMLYGMAYMDGMLAMAKVGVAATMKCIQCGSDGCGVSICRFSGMPNEEYLRVKQAVNNYANAMVKRDQGARNEGRPEHDMRCDGMPLRSGT